MKTEKKYSDFTFLLLVSFFMLIKTAGFTQNIKPYDILINEFMADPTPSVGLPNSEFIELYNRSNNTINLAGFKFVNGSVSTELPSFLLKPKKYVTIYTRKSTIDFGIFGDTLPVTKLIALSNPGDTFYLKSPDGWVMDVATFDLSFYQNSKKNDGGWSLERINPNAPCLTEGWAASEDLKGGTPGQKNSVLREVDDKTPIQLLNLYPKDDNTVVLKFDKSLDRNTVKENFEISNSLKINSLKIIEPDFKTVEINLNAKLILKNKYQLILKTSLKDCQGYPLSKNDTFLVQLPEKPVANDLIINELLFDTETGGSRYIELYNRSEKVLDVFSLKIADIKTKDIKTILNHFIIFPSEYIVITDDVIYCQKRYNALKYNRFFIKNKLPAWDDNNGNASIYVVEGAKSIILDSLDYSTDWHNPLLVTTEGVSLERVRPDVATNDKNNWQSAAETVKYGTPGYRNSQFKDTFRTSDFEDKLVLERNIFSPDDDGFEDFLIVNYNFKTTGIIANISIFDMNGRLIKDLCKGKSLESQGFIKWEGDSNDGAKAPIGLYILYAQLLKSDGQILTQKSTCALTGKF